MKLRYASLLILVLSFILTSFVVPKNSLVGKWQGESEGEIGTIIFDKEGYVSFSFGGETVGGKEYMVDGIVMDMYYVVDESVTPHNMDFVLKLHDGEMEVARMLGIYEFENKKTLLLNMNFVTPDRPTMMDENSPDQIRLTKMK